MRNAFARSRASLNMAFRLQSCLAARPSYGQAHARDPLADLQDVGRSHDTAWEPSCSAQKAAWPAIAQPRLWTRVTALVMTLVYSRKKEAGQEERRHESGVSAVL